MPLAPSHFIEQAQARGFTFSIKPGDQLGVKPPPGGSLPDPMRQYIGSMKRELLEVLRPVPREVPTSKEISPDWQKRSRLAALLEEIATGRRSWHWSGPARVCAGTVAEDPRRWCELALPRLSRAWLRAESSPSEVLALDLLLADVRQVLAQGHYAPAHTSADSGELDYSISNTGDQQTEP